MCERMEEVLGSISSRLTALEARPVDSPGNAAAAHVAGTPFGNASERSREQRPEFASSPHEKEVMKEVMEHAGAFVVQAYEAAQCAAAHPQHQWGYGCPLLGILDPDGTAKRG